MNPTGSFSSLDDWLPWLESLSPREIVLGLERVRDVLERLDLHYPELIVVVGGTNGKGSSVAMLDALLRGQGVRTGCYTSPHVSRYNERTRIDGACASDETIMSALQRVESVRQDIPLTFFEFGTLATLIAFDTAGVDAWILEVGMGGRLDAVNAIEPDASLITNVSLDHCAWLGNDTESIAREKAGIMRAGKPVVFGSTTVPDAIPRHAQATGARLLVAGRDFGYETSMDGTWRWHGRQRELTGLQRPSLCGRTQLQNASAVLALLEALGRDDLLDAAYVGRSLASIRLRGRFQVVDERWILDVVHNAGAALVLADLLGERYREGRTIGIVGMLGDKDIAGFITPLCAHVDAWIAVSIGGTRAGPAERLAREIANVCNRPCLVAADLDTAMRLADERALDCDRILVTGSFYIVGPALEWLQSN